MIAITEGSFTSSWSHSRLSYCSSLCSPTQTESAPRPTFYMPDHERTQIIHPHSVTIHGYQSPLATKTPQLHLVHATQNSSLRGELANSSPIFRPALPEEKPQTSSI